MDIQGDHSGCAKPPVDIELKVDLLLNATFTPMSMGGFAQPEWSLCTYLYLIIVDTFYC